MTAALKNGMVVALSYWGSGPGGMSWLDAGPCGQESCNLNSKVVFSSFAVSGGSNPPVSAPVPAPVPVSAPTPSSVSSHYSFVGCGIDNDQRSLPSNFFEASDMTHDKCYTNCKNGGFAYFGVEYARQCFCGNEPFRFGQAPNGDCNMACAGDSSKTCGAGWRISVFKINPTSTPAPKAPVPAPVASVYCIDTPCPGDSHTCAEQAAWGNCGADWMQGRCAKSCNRCGCKDTPIPGNSDSCAQHAAWGNCNLDYMRGLCDISCKRCTPSANREEQVESASDSGPNVGAIVGGVIGGLVALVIVGAIGFFCP
jgi:hypothetical protein